MYLVLKSFSQLSYHVMKASCKELGIDSCENREACEDHI